MRVVVRARGVAHARRAALPQRENARAPGAQAHARAPQPAQLPLGQQRGEAGVKQAAGVQQRAERAGGTGVGVGFSAVAASVPIAVVAVVATVAAVAVAVAADSTATLLT